MRTHQTCLRFGYFIECGEKEKMSAAPALKVDEETDWGIHFFRASPLCLNLLKLRNNRGKRREKLHLCLTFLNNDLWCLLVWFIKDKISVQYYWTIRKAVLSKINDMKWLMVKTIISFRLRSFLNKKRNKERGRIGWRLILIRFF